MAVNIAAVRSSFHIGENGSVDADSPASRTALGAARHRAVHQLLEAGSILEDPLAVRVTGDDPDELVARAQTRGDHRMRWFVCARSRFAEQVLADAEAAGVDQLVVLGAGLDTFAYRNPYEGLRVVEVDHPATQRWKLERLAEAGIEVPDTVVHAAVDFERQDLREVLGEVLDLDRSVLFWWLGVTPYLTRPAVESTLGRLGSLPSSSVVLDHATPLDDAPETAGLMRQRREAVARLGEPWVSAYAYPELAELVRRSGFTGVRPEDEGATIRRRLGLTPPDSQDRPRPSHLVLATRGWPARSGGQPRS
jgi:methyltransferase (TIGR00027 family)